jgi:hypothetical protein
MSGEGMISSVPADRPADRIAEELREDSELVAALPALRGVARGLLPDAHPAWLEQLDRGEFDRGPVMAAVIAGWRFARG